MWFFFAIFGEVMLTSVEMRASNRSLDAQVRTTLGLKGGWTWRVSSLGQSMCRKKACSRTSRSPFALAPRRFSADLVSSCGKSTRSKWKHGGERSSTWAGARAVKHSTPLWWTDSPPLSWSSGTIHRAPGCSRRAPPPLRLQKAAMNHKRLWKSSKSSHRLQVILFMFYHAIGQLQRDN